MFSVNTICFHGKLFDFFCWTNITAARHDDGIAPVYKNDYNKPNSHLIQMTQDTNWKTSIHRVLNGNSAISTHRI